MSLLYILVGFLSGAFLLYSFFQRKKQTNKNYPPDGPWSLPIVGHLLTLGPEPWKTLLKWKGKHGPIISIDFASFRSVVLNDPKSIRDAFSLPVFAGRPKVPMLKSLGHGKSFITIDGPICSEQRNFVIKQLKYLNAVKVAEEKIIEEVQYLLPRFSSECENGQSTPINHRFQISTMNSLWSLLMGYRYDLDDPKLLKLGKSVVKIGEIDGILNSLAIFMPVIGRIFPSILKKYYNTRQELCDQLNEEFKKPDPSYIPGQPRNIKEAFRDEMEANKLDPNSSFNESMNMFSYTAGELFIASIDTTSTVLEWIILYLSTNPEKQEKLYQDIKSNIGLSRIPCGSDRGRCHYGEAVVCESLRHSTILPLGVWHRAMDDVDDFHGYSIKKDMMVVSNIWGVHRDPELWEEPDEWRPERFISDDGKFQKSENILSFSYGRRNCLGEEIARQSLFIFTTSLVQRFHISHPKGKKPSLEPVVGMSLKPQPFEAIFTEREKL